MASRKTVAADDPVRPYVDTRDGKRSLHFSIEAVQSRVDLADPDRLDLEYTQLMMAALLLQARPAQIAMIGLGGGSLARFCLRHLPAAQVVVAEINPHVIALRQQFLVPPDSERFRVVEADGAHFLRQAGTDFDLLLVDGFDTWGLPPSLGTQRFFDDCARSLRPGGVLSMNLHAEPTREAQLLDRMRRSFGGVVLAVAGSTNSNRIAFAGPGVAGQAQRQGPLRRPRGFDALAWAELRPAFLRVREAWQNEFDRLR